MAKYQFSYFISYSLADKVEARQLKEGLMKRGRACWFDDDLDFGSNIGSEIVEGMKSSKRAVLILSPNFVDSAWTNFETWLNLPFDPKSSSRRILPVLLHECEIPHELVLFKYADARGGISEALIDEIIAKS